MVRRFLEGYMAEGTGLCLHAGALGTPEPPTKFTGAYAKYHKL